MSARRLAALAAAAPALPAYAQNAAPGIGAGQIFGLFAGTLLVLAVIVGAGWLLKRFNPAAHGGSGVLRVVAGAAVGQRERVVVVEVGESWLVLGVAPSSVNLLQQLPRRDLPAGGLPGAAPTAFAGWLKQMMDKRHAA